MESCTKTAEITRLQAEHTALARVVDSLDKQMNTRMDKVEKDVNTMYTLTSNVAVLAEQMKATKDDVSHIRNEVDKIKYKPVSNVDALKMAAIMAVITAVINVAMRVIFQ